MSKPVSNLEALDATEPYDACVIGAGIAGSLVAVRLARGGLRVLLVESRPPAHTASHAGGPQAIVREARGAVRAALGSADIWTDLCERFEPADLTNAPYARSSNAWPLGHRDIEKHYLAAEQMFRVRAAPARRARRLPPLSPTRADLELAALLRRHGVDAKGVAVATPGRGARTFDASREWLPELAGSRSGVLVCGATVTRLRADRNGRIVAATVRTPDGTSRTARADVYVLAAGAIETARLLLLSRSERFPCGIGNDHQRVGRALNDHAVLDAQGALAAPGVGAMRRSHTLHTEQLSRAFRRERLGAVHPFFRSLGPLDYARRAGGDTRARIAGALGSRGKVLLGVSCRIEMKPDDANRVELGMESRDSYGDPVARVVLGYSAEDLELVARTRAWLGRLLDRCGAASPRTPEPCAELGWAGDPLGTCRMGADPRTSVCDGTLRVHSSPNLYLCGGATFPTAGAVPAALTIAALADRLADHVIARARWCARATAKPKRRPPMPAVGATIPLVRRRPQP